jgi:peptidyl-prolyl cis-trans isomerase A (cyclophilin A)
MFKKNNNHLIVKSILACSLAFSSLANATIVEFITSQGNIQVNLFDQTTPKTVDNFLQYIDENHYTNSVIHRVAPNFVVQGGGFKFSGNWPLTPLTPNASVINEPIYSNVKGTIAMAKRGGNINSATNQWFFNLQDNNDPKNSQNLDVQNGGFTAFGQIVGDESLKTLEKIANLKLCDIPKLGNIQAFDGLPMVNYSAEECASQSLPGLENFVVIEQITIIDSSEVTDADLTPLKNTLINAKPAPTPSESSGGSLGWLALIALGLATARQRLFRK